MDPAPYDGMPFDPEIMLLAHPVISKFIAHMDEMIVWRAERGIEWREVKIKRKWHLVFANSREAFEFKMRWM